MSFARRPGSASAPRSRAEAWGGTRSCHPGPSHRAPAARISGRPTYAPPAPGMADDRFGPVAGLSDALMGQPPHPVAVDPCHTLTGNRRDKVVDESAQASSDASEDPTDGSLEFMVRTGSLLSVPALPPPLSCLPERLPFRLRWLGSLAHAPPPVPPLRRGRRRPATGGLPHGFRLYRDRSLTVWMLGPSSGRTSRLRHLWRARTPFRGCPTRRPPGHRVLKSAGLTEWLRTRHGLLHQTLELLQLQGDLRSVIHTLKRPVEDATPWSRRR